LTDANYLFAAKVCASVTIEEAVSITLLYVVLTVVQPHLLLVDCAENTTCKPTGERGQMTRYIILLGHRKQHGKDTCAGIIENLLPGRVGRSMFAELLKRQSCERYNLDYSKMELNEYKASAPEHLGGRTVRDVLIDEGCFGRSIWQPVWASYAYRQVIESGQEFGVITDYRFPNESEDFPEICRSLGVSHERIKLFKVLVHRPGGVFDNDGADGELPDLATDHWDFVINNDVEGDGWVKNLEQQVILFLNQFTHAGV
jgi:hypothetical protein